MGVPLRLKDASGNLQEFTSSEEQWLAYQIGLGLAQDSNEGIGGLTSSSDPDWTSIGSYTNTFFNEPVGTHPGTSITTGSTTTTLYQNLKTNAIEADSADWHRPIEWKSSGTEGVNEMDDTSLNDAVDRYLSYIFTNDYPGTYRLASSSPGPDYSVSISNIFTDTRADGTTTNFNLYRRTSYTPPAEVKPAKIKYTGDVIGAAFEGLKEMDNLEIKATFGQRAKNRISASGIGKYQLRSSVDGAPTDPGTWLSKGAATDTKQTTSDQNYTRNSTSDFLFPFTRNSTSNFTSPFSAAYTGAFTRNSTSPFDTNYQTSYVATYTGNFIGNYIRNFSAFYNTDYLTVYDGAAFTRDSTRNSTRDSTSGFIATFTRDSTRDSTRNSTSAFIGNYTGNFVGNYLAAFTRNSTSAFVGNFIGDFAGNYARNFTRDSTRSSTNTFGADFIGNYTRFFTAYYDRNFTRNRLVQYSRDIGYVRTLSYLGPQTGNPVTITQLAFVNSLNQPEWQNQQQGNPAYYLGPGPSGNVFYIRSQWHNNITFYVPDNEINTSPTRIDTDRKVTYGGILNNLTVQFVFYPTVYAIDVTGVLNPLWPSLGYQSLADLTNPAINDARLVYFASGNTAYFIPTYLGPGTYTRIYASHYIGTTFFGGRGVSTYFLNPTMEIAEFIGYSTEDIYIPRTVLLGATGYTGAEVIPGWTVQGTVVPAEQYAGLNEVVYEAGLWAFYNSVWPGSTTPWNYIRAINSNVKTGGNVGLEDLVGYMAIYGVEAAEVSFNTNVTYTRLITYSRTFAGNYLRSYAGGANADFLRTRTVFYTGNFLGNFIGNYVRNFTRNSTRDSTTSFTGDFTGNYERNFTRDSTTVFSATYTGDFTGNYIGNFVGNYDGVTYTGNFIGDYVGNFVGNYVGTYETAYTAAYETVYETDFTRDSTNTFDLGYLTDYTTTYTGDFTGNYETDFTGNYDADYVGDFTGNYDANYTGDFTGDFLGETIDATSTTNETYTLYVRVS